MSGRLLWILFLGVFFSFAFPSDDIYDQKGYYMFPIRPGEINYLSGSMGELRSTHFHAGIDIKTGGVQGYNVYAAADGFLNRVNVAVGGYGKALYIQHPNNTFTVYAHLRDFSDNVARYVLEQQYRKKSYAVDLFPKKGAFNYFKGDIIAASGNTGSSSAPHLHFEIRDENHRVLDPLRFDFPEIRDSRVPEVRTVAFKTMDIDARVNGQFGRYDFVTTRDENSFELKEPIDLRGKIGSRSMPLIVKMTPITVMDFPVWSFTWMTALFTATISGYSLSVIRGISGTHQLSPYAKYPKAIHKLYVDDGNQANFYNTEQSGLVDINDTLSHHFQVKLWDVEGNYSETNFKVNEGGSGKQKKAYG